MTANVPVSMADATTVTTTTTMTTTSSTTTTTLAGTDAQPPRPMSPVFCHHTFYQLTPNFRCVLACVGVAARLKMQTFCCRFARVSLPVWSCATAVGGGGGGGGGLGCSCVVVVVVVMPMWYELTPTSAINRPPPQVFGSLQSAQPCWMEQLESPRRTVHETVRWFALSRVRLCVPAYCVHALRHARSKMLPQRHEMIQPQTRTQSFRMAT